jgi:hypothetical protein
MPPALYELRRARQNKAAPERRHDDEGGRANNSGRARVPARREQVYVINLVKRWIWFVLGFGKNGSRGRNPSRSPVWLRYQDEKPSAF